MCQSSMVTFVYILYIFYLAIHSLLVVTNLNDYVKEISVTGGLSNYSNSRWCSALTWMLSRSDNGPLISLTLSLNKTMFLPSFLQ